MNLVAMLMVDLVGLKVTTKRPVGEKVPSGAVGVVRDSTLAGRIVFVEFEQEPGVKHRMERIDVEQVIEVTRPTASQEIPPPRMDDSDHDELP